MACRKVVTFLCCTLAVGLYGNAFCDPVKAYSADSFVDSIGVNTHFTDLNGSTTYGNYDMLRTKLLTLRIRHIRDAAHAYSTVTATHPYYQRLLNLTGVRFTMVTNTRNSISVIQQLPVWLKNRVDAFEGLNEPDISGSSTWVVDTRDWQTALYDGVKGALTSRKVPVYGPAICWQKTELGLLDADLDLGNIHTYASGRSPIEMRDNLIKLMSDSTVNSGTKPISVTETGYHDALYSTQQSPVPSAISAKYLPRLLMYFYQTGVKRTFLYELADEHLSDNTNMENAFGLVAADGTNKPTFKAMKNLVAMLCDRTTPTTLGSLDYTVSSSSSTIQTMLFQKNNGIYYLAIWSEQPAWDRVNRKELPVTTYTATVNFNTAVSACNLFKLANPTVAAASFGATQSVSLPVNDVVQFLQVTPG